MSIFSNMKDMMNMASKAKEIQENLKKAQAEIAQMTETVNDGANGVSVTMSGELFVVDVKIAKDSPVLGNSEALERAVKNAMNESVTAIKARIQMRMKEATGGIDIPGLM